MHGRLKSMLRIQHIKKPFFSPLEKSLVELTIGSLMYSGKEGYMVESKKRVLWMG